MTATNVSIGRSVAVLVATPCFTSTAALVVCRHSFARLPDHEAAHSCGRGDKGCVTKRHLIWKTHQGNMHDMIEHGTAPRGARNHCAVFTEVDIVSIRNSTETQSALARAHGVTRQTIHSIIHRRTWAWVV